MDQEAQLKLEARKAEEARSALRNKLGQGTLADAFEALRRDLQRQMSAVKATDTQTKDKLIDMWQLVDSLERYFVKTIQTGDAAVLQLEEKKKFKLFSR